MKGRVKFKVISLFVVILILLCFASTVYGEGIIVSVNGKDIEMKESILIKDGVTLVPIRLLGENLGLDVKWDENNNKILLNDNSNLKNIQGVNVKDVENYIRAIDLKNNIHEEQKLGIYMNMGSSIVDSMVMAASRYDKEAFEKYLDQYYINEINIKEARDIVMINGNLFWAEEDIKKQEEYMMTSVYFRVCYEMMVKRVKTACSIMNEEISLHTGLKLANEIYLEERKNYNLAMDKVYKSFEDNNRELMSLREKIKSQYN